MAYPIDPSEKISIKAKALAGGAFVEAPDLKAESKFGNSYATYTRDYGSAIAPAILLGAGLEYSLNNRFSIFINSEYFMTTKVSFKGATEVFIATDELIIPGFYSFKNSYSIPYIYGQTGTRKQTIKSLNLNVGFSFSW